MFLAGDEFCNTQFGNNNAYCQDNIISWLDWNRLEEYKEIHDFARYMIHFRAAHPIIRKDTKAATCGFPFISVHNGEPYRDYTNFSHCNVSYPRERSYNKNNIISIGHSNICPFCGGTFDGRSDAISHLRCHTINPVTGEVVS